MYKPFNETKIKIKPLTLKLGQTERGRQKEWEIEGIREVDQETWLKSSQRGVDIEALMTIFGGDDKIDHGWVDLQGSSNENKMTRLRSVFFFDDKLQRWQERDDKALICV